MKKYLFLDVEATGPGTNENHTIIDLGAHAYFNDAKVDTIHLQLKPEHSTIYHKKGDGTWAMKGRARTHMSNGAATQATGFQEFLEWLGKLVNPYDKKDKFVVIGYNSRWDERHIINWFKKQKNRWIKSYFHPPFVDVQELLLLKKGEHLWSLKDRKLPTVAAFLGLDVVHEELHNPCYDAQLAANVFYKLQE